MSSEYLIISKYALNGIIQKVLQEATEAKPFMSQSAASKLVGRKRLERAMREGKVSWHKLDYDNRFSPVMVSRKDVEKLLNC